MSDLGVSKTQLAQGAGFRNQTIVTNLIKGNARLELKYVPAVAKVLKLNQHQLMLVAMQGFLGSDDVPFLAPFLPSVEELEILEALRKCGGESLKQAQDTLAKVATFVHLNNNKHT